MEKFLLSADVGREIGLTPHGIRRAVKVGHLKVAGTTASGTRLYDRAGIDEYKQFREQRRILRDRQLVRR